MPDMPLPEGGDAVGPCNPSEDMVFQDPARATTSAARAMAQRNNADANHPLREYHAQVLAVPGGYSFRFNQMGPPKGGTVPFEISRKAFGSAHNHESDSDPHQPGMLSSGRNNATGLISYPSDAVSYRIFLRQAARQNRDIFRQLHVGLADTASKRPGIYLWRPGRSLNRRGEFVGPVLCSNE